MNDFTLFLGKFLRHGTSIASVAPSSRWLSQATVGNIDWGKARAVVELGAGTGPITRVIARNAAPECRVVLVERDPDFARLLRERFQERPNFDIVAGDVCDLADILGQRGIDRVDHVISGLPVPSLPRATQQALFEAVGKVMRSDGTDNQITEIPWVYWPFYRRHFHDVQFKFEPRNLPPAGAYICRGIRQTAVGSRQSQA
jgi:phospholipid N-methyltransferase